jgi:parallel beta-helix repeat protein
MDARAIPLLIAACFTLATVSSAPLTGSTSSGVIYVDGTNDGFEDGTREHPYNTIQEGIDAASPGNTVLVAAGTYYEHITMKPGVIIKGAGPEVTTIDGSGSGRVVTGADDSTLEGFTITGGGHQTSGGGVYCSGTSPNITNNVITGNETGVVVLHGSNPRISNNFIVRNGGGVYINFSSSPTLVNNVVARNFNGIFIDHSSSPVITNNTIVYNEYSFAILNYYFAGSPVITNNIIAYNQAGVVAFYKARAIVTYSNIWGNRIDYIGFFDYLYLDPEHENDPTVWLHNISADPRFVDPANDDFRLREDSPCIDAGTNDAPGLPETDLDGNPRSVDGDVDGVERVDMGAFEYPAPVIRATIDLDPDTLNLRSGGRWITCYIELPEGHDVADIDISTVRLEGEVQAEARPTQVGDSDDDEIPDLMVKFDRSAVQGLLEVGDVELTVTGTVGLVNFQGSDTARVITSE